MITLRLNLDAMESINFFWQALKDREKVSEAFIQDVAMLEGYSLIYDQEFTAAGVQRVMSALSNREPFKAENQKEGRLYNNHLWMMDDLGVANAMLQAIKLLNLDGLRALFSDSAASEEIVVYFVPFHTDAVVVKGNSVVMNFFKVQPDLNGGDADAFDGLPLMDAIEKIIRGII